jgi:hypothetical protein
MEKTRQKEVLYDKMSLSESALTLFIVFGLLLTALAMSLGYFTGNRGGAAIPAIGRRQEESEGAEPWEAVEDQISPEAQDERFDEVEE